MKFPPRDFLVAEPVSHFSCLEPEGVPGFPIRPLCLFDSLDLLLRETQALLKPNDGVG
jgi:hypothetical protein